MIKILFIHYHLRTGGVTTVVTQQAKVLADTCDLLVAAGDIPENQKKDLPFDTAVIPGLGYDRKDVQPDDPDDVADQLMGAVYKKWENGCDLVHVHNATLAKNKNFIKILKNLQRRGLRLLIQIHDFAEDGRPHAFYSDFYPENCHFAVINSRDYNLLSRSGLRPEGLHFLPNMVREFDLDNNSEKISKKIVLYPVRAVRRKNIGEALLMSLFFKNDETLAITRPASSDSDMKPYERWKAFAQENDLNVIFEAGLKFSFEALFKNSEWIITTSITEGFGFSFLDPWMAQKFLWGRRIRDLCADFVKKGVKLDHLYDGLYIPFGWIDSELLFEKWKDALLSSCRLYGHMPDKSMLMYTFNKMERENKIDFGMLDETFQQGVVFRILAHEKNRKKLVELNPFLKAFGHVKNQEKIITHNKDAIAFHYNREKYKKNLVHIYTRVMKTDVCHRIKKSALLNHFLQPDNFSLLKWGQGDE
ncbi:hypothetical protein QUF76_09515 [Desulfobacterales bacterium HSG16]|nr:hypothetical protein [Desulfobacterales bacterium HSG16]